MAESPTALMQQLHDEHAAALWGFCLHLTSDPVRAEDVAQETLLRAWQHYEVLDEARGSVRSWLFTVARNIVIDEWRSKRSQNERPVDQVPEPGDPVDQTDTLLQSWVVAEAITSLSPEHRNVLLECYYRGRSVAEASRRLGVPEGTVKSRTHYALRALRLALEEMGVGRMTAASFEHEDGAYVLGALSPEDRVAFERHLPGCADCARSVRELAGLPGLLARVPVEIVDPSEPPQPVPDTLLPALVRRVRRTQRRRTWVTGGLVAAAAAVAVGAVGVATLGDDDDSAERQRPRPSGPTTAAPEPMRPVGDEPVSGWVSLTQVGWGTRLDLTCSYAEDEQRLPATTAPPTYTMFVTTGPTAAPSRSPPGRGCPARPCT